MERVKKTKNLTSIKSAAMTRTSQVKKRRRRWAIKTLEMITATKISWRTRMMKIQI